MANVIIMWMNVISQMSQCSIVWNWLSTLHTLNTSSHWDNVNGKSPNSTHAQTTQKTSNEIIIYLIPLWIIRSLKLLSGRSSCDALNMEIRWVKMKLFDGNVCTRFEFIPSLPRELNSHALVLIFAWKEEEAAADRRIEICEFMRSCHHLHKH